MIAILALDCLLIDTIQSFREGRITTGDVSPAQSFKTFLSSQRFADFTRSDRGEFFQYVRNAILHNGETRKDWKIRIDTKRVLERDPVMKTRTINRHHFHTAIEQEFRDLVAVLESGDVKARQQLLRRLEARRSPRHHTPGDKLTGWTVGYNGGCRAVVRPAYRFSGVSVIG